MGTARNNQDGLSSAALPTRTLGRTWLALTTLGFGSTGLGNLYRAQIEGAALATVQAAYNAGIRYFDTAPLYGFGLAEHRLGAAMRHIGSDLLLSTKAGWRLSKRDAIDCPAGPSDSLFDRPAPFKPRIDYSYDGVMRSFEDSMQRLGTDRIDILLLHDCDRRNHGDAYPERFQEAMDGAYRALFSLREQGAVRAIGAGLNEWEACQAFAEAGDAVFGGKLRQGQLTPDCIRRHLGLELSPVALLCHFTYNVPSLTQAGPAYHPVRNSGATSVCSVYERNFP